MSELSHDSLHTSRAFCNSVNFEDSCARWDQLGEALQGDWTLSLAQAAVQQEEEQMARIMYHQTFLPSWLFTSYRPVSTLQDVGKGCSTHALRQDNTQYTLILACLPKSVLSCISLLYLRHHRVNIWFSAGGACRLWCRYRDQFGHRFSLYMLLSWPGIPQPRLVNTPTGLKTNWAAADKHEGPSRLCSRRYGGHYHVGAPADSGPTSLLL